MWDAGANVYWFRLVRGAEGVDWVPRTAGTESGIGRQLTVTDLNADGLADFVVGGMRGAFAVIHERKMVDEATWAAAQPRPYAGGPTGPVRGAAAEFEGEGGRIAGAIEGEAMTVVEATAGKTSTQAMAGFKAGRWSECKQLLWSGAGVGAKLTLEFEAPAAGEYDVALAMTTARDFAMVRVALDDEPAGEAIDLYDRPEVGHTGLVSAGRRRFTAGKHRMTVEITGANAAANRAYLFGLDCLVLKPVR
jgi:hypothetical protein